MPSNTAEQLRTSGIQPSAQRVAVAEFVLSTASHPSADDVFRAVRHVFPMISRATVYNTLNLFVDKGLLRKLDILDRGTVFDPNLTPHHHFIDDESGQIHDLFWSALRVAGSEDLEGYEVREYQVVLRGRARPRRD